jgi:hypothetical protein
LRGAPLEEEHSTPGEQETPNALEELEPINPRFVFLEKEEATTAFLEATDRIKI